MALKSSGLSGINGKHSSSVAIVSYTRTTLPFSNVGNILELFKEYLSPPTLVGEEEKDP
jgi:hypothetical protein